jgi:hemolysin III
MAAFVVAIALCPIVIVFSPGRRPAVALFATAVVGLFGISGAYHCLFWGTRAQGIFRRLDHAMIFVLIAATYTPVALAALPSPDRFVLLGTVWTGALLGALSSGFWPSAPRWLAMVLYIAIGWAVLPAAHQVWISVGVAGFILLLVGGLLHTSGAVVFATRRPDPSPAWFGFHEIFHVMVIAAIATHYVVIAFLISPAPTPI